MLFSSLDEECTTDGGRDHNKTCIFPFKSRGKTYNTCTRDHIRNQKPWCATDVNSDDGVAKNWGYCGPSCGECFE